MSAKLETRAALSIEEAAEELGICTRMAYKRIKDGSLPSVRLGRRVLIPTHRLKALLDGELEETTTS